MDYEMGSMDCASPLLSCPQPPVFLRGYGYGYALDPSAKTPPCQATPGHATTHAWRFLVAPSGPRGRKGGVIAAFAIDTGGLLVRCDPPPPPTPPPLQPILISTCLELAIWLPTAPGKFLGLKNLQHT